MSAFAQRGGRLATAAWLALVLPVAVAMIAIAGAPAAWTSPRALFWFVLVVASLCLAGAITVFIAGWRRRLAEVALLGSALVVLSILPLVHGLTTPGVLYGPNPATLTSVFVAGPLALAAALPLLLPPSGVARALARAWRPWTLGWMLATAAVAVAFLVDPRLPPAPTPRSVEALVTLGITLSGCLWIAARHWRLWRIGRRAPSFWASVGFAYVGVSNLVWLVEQPFSVAFWGAHVIDALGVLAAVGGLFLAHRRDRSLATILDPVLNRDPLVALELGLTPVVHRFVGALEEKDPITRDHVIRVGELAMRAGVRAGLDAGRLRALGLGALLHDVGKLFTPDDLLNKPGQLTDAEFTVIKEHTVLGAELMRTSRLLAPAAELVRWHHERADGTGYPDGLRAAELPAEVGIISVCDAWDAMTSMRQYRGALHPEAALSVLCDGAGTQWTEGAVSLVTDELAERGPVRNPIYSQVGRDARRLSAAREESLLDGCCQALPEYARVALQHAPAGAA